jgi:HlyD family secretion protein
MSKTKRGAVAPAIITIIILAAGAAGLLFLFRDAEGDARPVQLDAFVVQRGGFDIAIPVSGELAAQQQVEVRNQLESRSTIMEIVGEGETVKAGDLLLRLNDEEITERIRDAEIGLKDADNDVINAQSNLEIRKQERAAAIQGADLAVYLNELALLAWEDGEEISKRKELELAIETAEKRDELSKEVYEKSVELEKQKFLSRDQMKRDEISMIEARARLETARLDLEVYEKYLFEQDKAQKESDVEQAKDRRMRVEEEYDAKIRMVESDLESRESRLADGRVRLEQYRRQLDYCTVTAPTSGLVVYASSLRRGGRNEGQPPQVGTELSRNELVMVIPDVSQMVAEVKVSEALSGMIEAGQGAVIYSDALPEQAIEGEVASMGVLAEGGGWRDPNRRDYTVRILLEETEGLGLKPSMRCKADIYVGHVDDAVFIPIQSVHRSGAVAYVYVPRGGGYAQRPVQLGRASELFIEVLDGLEEGDVVLMREPGVEEIVEKLDVADEENGGNGGRRRGGDGPPGGHGGMQGGPPAGMSGGGEGRGGPPASREGMQRGGEGRGGPPAGMQRGGEGHGGPGGTPGQPNRTGGGERPSGNQTPPAKPSGG